MKTNTLYFRDKSEAFFQGDDNDDDCGDGGAQG